MEYLTYEVIDTKISVLFTFGLLTFMMGTLFFACLKKKDSMNKLIGLVFLITIVAFLKSLFEAGECQ